MMAMTLLELTRHLPRAQLLQLAGAGVERLRNAVVTAHPLPWVAGCTRGLFTDPHRFVLRTCARLGGDAFQGRVLFRRTVFLMGEEAAVLFYSHQLLQRQGVSPLPLQWSLLEPGGLSSLDDAEHHRRKALLMELVAGPAALGRLVSLVGQALREAARGWPLDEPVDFLAEVRLALTRSVGAWAGLPLADEEKVERRCGQLCAPLTPGRLFGLPRWRVWWQGQQALRWCQEELEAVSTGRREAPRGSVLHALAHYRDAAGHPLPPRVAAVELLNILRPVVAVSVYAGFVLVALQTHPRYRERLREDDMLLPAFVQEVRRFYPFVPLALARTRQAFEWRGLRFPAGVRVLLDLYGTNHDPRAWEAPDTFYPERFLERTPGSYALIPQGGGDAHVHHRCPGEALTLALMEDIARLLCREISYEGASGNTELNWGQVPPLPMMPAHLQLQRGASEMPRPSPLPSASLRQ